MYNFLVLGLIPGTDIQIGFWTWIIVMLGLLAAFKKYRPHLLRFLNNWWHQFDEDELISQRQPLPAKRLHLRGL